MSVRGAGERIFAGERAGYDATDAMFAVQNSAGDFAIAVQFMNRYDIFMRSDLKNAVGRGVNDELSGFDMLFAVVFDNFCAGVGFVAKNFSAGFFDKFVDNILRETIRLCRERFGRNDASYFPMTYRRVFAHRGFT